MNKGKAILAVLAGMATGAILGALFAPEKGRDTRKKISRKGEDLADEIDELVKKRFAELMNSVSFKGSKSNSSGLSKSPKEEVV